MKPASSNLLYGLLAGLFVAAYAVFSHYTSILPNPGVWVFCLALIPVLIVGRGWLLSILRRPLFLALLALAGGGLYWLWPHLRYNVSLIYFFQHIGTNGGLGLLFARSLRNGRQPLCAFFAGLLRPPQAPPMSLRLQAYLRRVTQVWVVFFALMVLVSLALFFWAPIEVWSVFANLLTWPLVGAMFVVEFWVQRLRLPPEDRLGDLFSAWRAFRHAAPSLDRSKDETAADQRS